MIIKTLDQMKALAAQWQQTPDELDAATKSPEAAAKLEAEVNVAWKEAQAYVNWTPNCDDNDPERAGRPWSGAVQITRSEIRSFIDMRSANPAWEKRYLAAKSSR